ncbi:MAG: M43 family zinc metalloprotease [Bacteroidota bacterium]
MKRFLCSLLLLSSISTFAQRCATDELYEEYVKQNPQAKIEEEKANAIARDYAAKLQMGKKGTVIYIPVVFHIIHNSGLENITQAQINDCIRVLNEDYRKMVGTNGGASTNTRAADAEIEFRLAQYDPNGNPMDGVNRILNAAKTVNADNTAKALSYWDSKKYFNIWVVNTIAASGSTAGTTLGYAQFPNGGSASTDGIIVRADNIGAIGYQFQQTQWGRTVTHEAGHWCGLYHTFQGGCVGATASNCAGAGDQVCDTPPVATSTSGCPTSQNSCTNDVPDLPDNVQNYMDYADGTCMNMYTAGQVTRMKSLLSQYRSTIYSASNISAAGLNADGTYKVLTPATVTAPFNTSFQETTTTWFIENFNNPVNGWAVNNSVGFDDNNCMSISTFKNGATSTLNTRDAFHTRNYNISQLTNPTLTFKVAHARRVAGSTDQLNVYVSDNYGRTEILARTYTVTDIETADVTATEFVPTSSQWKTITLDLAAYKTYTNFRVRFELQARRGNNTYIDNVSISTPVGVADGLKENIKFSLNPNPSNSVSKLSFTTQSQSNINISIFDISGKLVKNICNDELSSGEHTFDLNASEFAKGLYIIKFQENDKSFNQKWLVE